MLLLIGTAHVLDLALPLERVLRGFAPEVVALELDRPRWEALRQRARHRGGPLPSRGGPRSQRSGPLLLRLLAALQARLGETFGSPPGGEMLVAARAARSLGAELALIDLPVVLTLRRAWRAMPWRERFGLAGETLRSLVGTETVRATVHRARGDFSTELADFAARFPTLQRELIDRRDRHMAYALVMLMRQPAGERGGAERRARGPEAPGGPRHYRRVAAVVGEGHLAGLARRLARLRPQVVPLQRLLALRDGARGSLRVAAEE